MSSFIHPQFLRLLSRVAASTSARQVQWKMVNEVATLQLDHGAITIEARDNDGVPPLVVRVLDGQGRTIESVMTDDGILVTEGNEHVNLQTVFETARRDALGVSQVLDALIGDLTPKSESDDDIPY